MNNPKKNPTAYISIILLLCSCTESKSTMNNPTVLDFPASESYNALVNANNEIVVLINGGERRDLQWYAKEGDKEFSRFSFIENTNCYSTKNYHAYENLPDGRLQIWKWCLTGHGGVDYLLAYDWSTSELEKIIGPLPLGSSGASWNPEQTKAIGYLDSGFATSTLYWIYPNKFETLDLIIADGHHAWNLKDDFPDFKADDNGQSGSTGRAAWSPDGKTIAFFASPDAIGKTGFDRFYVEYQLYLMNPENLAYDAFADKVFSPFLLAWSPDSSYIAFIGKYGFWKGNGIWLFSVKDGSIKEISKGKYQSLLWRGDGNRLVAIKCENIDVCNKIIEFDLTQLIEE